MLIKFGVFIQKIAFRKYVDVSGEVGLAINLTFKIHFNQVVNLSEEGGDFCV